MDKIPIIIRIICFPYCYLAVILNHSNQRNSNQYITNDKLQKNSEENKMLIDSIVVDSILQPLVNRLLEMKKQIHNQENLVCVIKMCYLNK